MTNVQLPRFRFGETEYIADLRLGEFRAAGNFIVTVQFASERGRQFCRMAGGGGRLDIIIPEPGTVMLIGVGAMALVGRRRAG